MNISWGIVLILDRSSDALCACEGDKFLFNFKTAVNVNKCLTQIGLPITLHAYALLQFYIGTTRWGKNIEEETRIEQKRSYFFLHFSIWHL